MYLIAVEAVTSSTSHFPVTATAILGLGFVAAASIGSFAWFRAKRPIGWEARKPTGEAQAPGPQYDRGIVPAETAARKKREGASYKQTPVPEAEGGNAHTTDGYTSDREGLVNNYAIEPEPYVEQPGDLRDEEKADAKRRAKELAEINQPGGRGSGVI